MVCRRDVGWFRPELPPTTSEPNRGIGSANVKRALVKLPSRRTLDFKETDSRSFCNFLRGLRPPVSLLLHSRKFTLQAKLKNVKPHQRDSNQGRSAYRADALTTAPWCYSHPQRRKHDISQLDCTYLQPHTTQVGLRPQTIVGSATFLVKLPSRRTLDFKETDSRSFCNFLRGLRPPCLASFTLPKIHFASKLKNVKPHQRDSNQGPSAYRADALTTAPWCYSHPQRSKHDISQLDCTYLQPHTTQVGLRPQTIVGSATFLVKLPSRRTLDFKETDSRSFCNFLRGLRPPVSLPLHSRKFTYRPS